MPSRVIHVVGDRFVGFAHGNPEVITISELERQLEAGELRGELDIIVGQGLQADRLQRLQAHAAAPGNAARMTVHVAGSTERAERPLTHKHFEQNVMISMPVQVGEHRYEANLLLDDRCAEMGDHVTGRHVQGMVLAEAARQLAVAVVEHFYLRRPEAGPSRAFVLSKLDINYHSFAFPVSTRLECNVLERKTGRRNALPNEVEVCIYQGGELIVDGRARIEAYDAGFMRTVEAERARRMLTKVTPMLAREQG